MMQTDDPVEAPLLEFRDLSRVYGSGDAEVRALRDVNLSISADEFIAVMGPSGSGKSTCLNILGCLDEPTEGHYFFHGEDVGQLTIRERAMLRRNQIGFVFQSFNLLTRTSAVENVELPLVYQRVARRERHERAKAALDKVGLSDRSSHTPSQLSGGQRQRVAIARAIVGEPKVLLADEPTGNLDTKSGADVMRLITDLHHDQNVAVVLVTHETHTAKYAQRSIRFLDGKLYESSDEDSVLPEANS